MTVNLALAGRLLLATGVAALGLVMLATGAPIARLTPLPESFAAGAILAWMGGVALVCGAVGLLVPRIGRLAGLLLTALFLADVILAQGPHLLAKPSSGGRWSEAFIALGLGASVLLASARTRDVASRGAGIAYGLALVVFGLIHWLYRDAIAGMIPQWIPARAWWPWLTGAANLAAGLSVISGVRARLGALCVGAMFGSWVLVLHLPAVVAAPGSATEWTALAIALGLWGGAWLVSGETPDRA
ncbi:MAG: hypothetical protein JSR45_02320 [Proteobacteria bacterium]|nr:hypothetical protein [Pseudomonadota bacterium]